MKLQLDDTFLQIARSIVAEGKTVKEWAEIESDDMFQSGAYVGGYDATEQAFTFSFYGESEYWFQLTLDEIRNVCGGQKLCVVVKTLSRR